MLSYRCNFLFGAISFETQNLIMPLRSGISPYSPQVTTYMWPSQPHARLYYLSSFPTLAFQNELWSAGKRPGASKRQGVSARFENSVSIKP